MASLIGTTIEWYDFFLYGSAAALVFNRLFFPSYDPLTGTLLAFATYALGFVARPVGGIVFGHYGDRIGRKRLLMLSLILMGVATVLIGLLPTYAQIGIWAPIALIVLRLVQGFAVGGEWGGAVLMAAEHGDAARRGFWASWPQAGVAAGNLLAAGVLAADRGGCRARPISSPGAGGCRSCCRSCWSSSAGTSATGSRESQTFEEALAEAEAPPKLPALDVLRERPRAVVLGAGPQGRREHLLLHPHRLLADLPGRRRRGEPQPGAQRAADRRRGAVLRHPAVRRALGPDRAAAGLCVRRPRPGGVELRLVPAAGERRQSRRSSSRSSSASSCTARCTGRRRR